MSNFQRIMYDLKTEKTYFSKMVTNFHIIILTWRQGPCTLSARAIKVCCPRSSFPNDVQRHDSCCCPHHAQEKYAHLTLGHLRKFVIGMLANNSLYSLLTHHGRVKICLFTSSKVTNIILSLIYPLPYAIHSIRNFFVNSRAWDSTKQWLPAAPSKPWSETLQNEAREAERRIHLFLGTIIIIIISVTITTTFTVATITSVIITTK